MALLLGEKINKKVNESKKTAHWLSKKSDVSFGVLYPILTNKRQNPMFSTMEKLVRAVSNG
ncbi:XRE family transcriptional regulator [Leuconostoc carnosum]|uniref:XRE family transcriptional regulator n=1 Tax=Leuconostoc carnosum TaxID=1252 RepID=UPI00345D6AB2